MTPRILVVAKAPVAGEVKTRLGQVIGDESAAWLAAGALLDTLAAAAAVGPAHLCFAGDLDRAVDGGRIRALLADSEWQVTRQRGEGFAERLVNAHHDAGPGAVVQIGMDTPQVTPDLLRAAAAPLANDDCEAVLAPASDGGWWALARVDAGLTDVLAHVEMSTSETYDLTRRALLGAGARVADAPVLTDVDTVADADVVAAAAPDTEFARRWQRVRADLDAAATEPEGVVAR